MESEIRKFNYRNFMKNINSIIGSKEIVTKGEAKYYHQHKKTFKTTAPIIKRGKLKYETFDLKKINGEYIFFVGPVKKVTDFFEDKQGNRSKGSKLLSLLLYNYLIKNEDNNEHAFSQWLELLEIVPKGTIRYIEYSDKHDKLDKDYNETIRYLYKQVFKSALKISRLEVIENYFMKDREIDSFMEEKKYLEIVMGKCGINNEKILFEKSDKELKMLYQNIVKWNCEFEYLKKEEMIMAISKYYENLDERLKYLDLYKQKDTRYNSSFSSVDISEIENMNSEISQYCQSQNYTSKKDKKRIRDIYIKQVFEADYYMLNYSFNINQLKFGRKKYRFSYKNQWIEISKGQSISTDTCKELVEDLKNEIFNKRVKNLIDQELKILNDITYFVTDLKHDSDMWEVIDGEKPISEPKKSQYAQEYCKKYILKDLDNKLYNLDLEYILKYYESTANSIVTQKANSEFKQLEIVYPYMSIEYQDNTKKWIQKGIDQLRSMQNY